MELTELWMEWRGDGQMSFVIPDWLGLDWIVFIGTKDSRTQDYHE